MFHYVDQSVRNTIDQFSKVFDFERNFGLIVERAPLVEERELFLIKTTFADKAGRSGGGAGINKDMSRAAFAAMAEALERYSFCVTEPEILNHSYSEMIALGKRCFDPRTFQVFHPEQDVFIHKQVYRPTAESKLDWCAFENPLDSSSVVFIPSEVNHFFKFKVPFYFASSTSGNGCGLNPAQAKLSAIHELLERDAVMFYWWTQNPPRKISFKGAGKKLEKFLGQVNKDHKKISFFYLETDLDIPVILAVFKGINRNEPRFVVSAASHLDPLIALEKSYSELIHCLQDCYSHKDEFGCDYKIDPNKTIWHFIDHVLLYAQTRLDNAYDFLFLKKPKYVNWDELRVCKQMSSEHDLQFIYDQFKANNYRLFLKDITASQILNSGFAVYRAFSPDLISMEAIHKYRQLGYPRLYRLCEKLNLKKRPQRPSDLNPFPHPFP